MSMNEVIATNISNLLSQAKKKQQDLADAIKMPKQTVSKMLNGTRSISAFELKQIAIFLNVSMDSLVTEQVERSYSPIKVFMGSAKTEASKKGIEIAEKLMDIYSFHNKYQTKEFIDNCNQVWSDE